MATNWRDPNTMMNLVPGETDTARFTNANNNNSKIDASFAGSVGGIKLDGYAGTITLEHSLTAETFEQFSGTIVGAFPINVRGGSLQGGTLNGDADPDRDTLTIAQGTTFVIAGNVALNGRHIKNNGTIQWQANPNPTGSTITTACAGIYNLGTGVLEVTGVLGNSMATLAGGVAGYFINHGLVDVQTGTTLNVSIPATNTEGTIKADGNVIFNENVTFEGGQPIAPETTNLTGGGSVLTTANAAFAVTGATSSDVESLSLGGGASISAGFTVSTGLCTFAAGSFTLANANSTLTVNVGASLNIIGNLTVNNGAVVTLNSFLAQQSSWNGGTITLEGNALVVNNGNFHIGPAAQAMTGTGTFRNSDSITVAGSPTIGVTFATMGAATLDLTAGVLTLDGSWTQAAGASTTFHGGDLKVNGDLTNNGSVFVEASGRLTVGTFANNEIITFTSFAVPPPPLTAYSLSIAARPGIAGSGNFSQGANSSLSMRITGINANDFLAVEGTATLGGDLFVAKPMEVEVFTNWSWTLLLGQRQGTFADVVQPFGFSAPAYDPNAVHVQNPDIQVPGPQNANANVALVFSAANNNAITFPFADSSSAQLQITLAVYGGTLTLSQTTGLTFSSGTGTGDSSMTFVGTIDDINAALEGLTFTSIPGYYGLTTLQIGVADVPGYGEYFDNKYVAIDIV